jgi:hypothetical protein
MPRQANWLSNIEVDEISLVDRPANQHARVAIAKRAPEETVDYYNEKGEVVDVDALDVGDVVYDDTGSGFVIEDEDDEEEAPAEKELASVGKSLAEQVREDLSKALGDVERDEVISKAMEQITKAEKRATDAELIAKSERDLRLTREYISKADEYGVPGVTPQELGPVLMRAAELLPYEDCVVLNKALTSSGAAFAELGASGSASNQDAFGVIEDLLVDGDGSEELAKAFSDKSVNKHEVIEKAFEADPAAYDRYLADRRG